MAAQDLEVAVARLEALRSQAENLARQSEVLRLTLEEYARAQETMRRYKDTGDGADMLVPVGGSSFLYAKVSDPDRALVNIGSDVVLEDDIDTSIERLQRRIDHLGEASEQVGRLLQDTDAQIQRLTRQIQEAYAQAQQEVETPG